MFKLQKESYIYGYELQTMCSTAAFVNVDESIIMIDFVLRNAKQLSLRELFHLS